MTEKQQDITLRGKLHWGRLWVPDPTYGKYGLDLLLDEENLKVAKENSLRVKHKDDYDKAGNVLDSIFVGPDGGQTGQYYVLQKRKAELYKKLKELEATYTGNRGWAAGFGEMQPPALEQPTVQGPPPVTPPPAAERKVKRPF